MKTVLTKNKKTSKSSSTSFFAKSGQGHYFPTVKNKENPFFQSRKEPVKLSSMSDTEGKENDTVITLEQAVKPDNPTAIAKELSEKEIQEAISYNKKRFRNAAELSVIRDVLGLSFDNSEIDAEFVKTVAQWQAEYNLVQDGKIGPRTAAVLGYEMLEESKIDSALKPNAIRMLERGITVSLPGNSYTDTATTSKKNITFSAFIPKGLKRKNYAFVNWVKGYAKNGTGKYYQAKLYGTNTNINFGSYQVDSVDTDPIYWSIPGSRWNFNTSGSRRFTATDSPGPVKSTSIGDDFKLNFKLQLYRLADLPAVTSGNLGGAESKVITTVFWDYKVKVSAKGTFTHSN